MKKLKIINRSYKEVDEVYKLYVRAKRENNKVAIQIAEKCLMSMQVLCRFGTELEFSYVLKPLFDKYAEQLGPDIYIVDKGSLASIMSDLQSSYCLKKNKSKYF